MYVLYSVPGICRIYRMQFVFCIPVCLRASTAMTLAVLSSGFVDDQVDLYSLQLNRISYRIVMNESIEYRYEIIELRFVSISYTINKTPLITSDRRRSSYY